MKQNLLKNKIIQPDWEAPVNVKSLVTTRCDGYSKAPFDSFNLGAHVEDNNDNVRKNRQRLAELLPSEPIWLNQVHSDLVVDAGKTISGTDADGSYTTQANVVSVVLTADCLPVLVCTRQGDGVAALHAGWRGLANGILEQGIEKLLAATKRRPEDLLVWLGPAIGPENFEVGEDVRQSFLQQSMQNSHYYTQIEQCFTPSKNTSDEKNKWFADIYQLARIRLSLMGVENCSGGNYCTYNDKEKFYSYRRDGKTGRMASLIWLVSPHP